MNAKKKVYGTLWNIIYMMMIMMVMKKVKWNK